MKQLELVTEEITTEINAEVEDWIANKGLLMFDSASSVATGAVKEFLANSKGYTHFPIKVRK